MKSHPVAVIGVALLLVITAQRPGVGQGTPPEGSSTVTVSATHPWVDSGLTVRKGDRLSFQTSGTIQWGSKPDQVAGPEGHNGKPGKLGVGGLIGRVGFTGKPFPVGKTSTPLTMPQSGKLFLGINDFIFKDNAGSFVVTIIQSGV